MAKYRVVSALSPTDAAYIAGLIDGEGTISLTRKHARDNRQLQVSICNTEICILAAVHAAVGAGKITRKRTVKAAHAIASTYSVCNRQALALLAAVYPYLRSYKRCRAKLVLDHYCSVTPRNGKYTPALRASREAFIARFFAEKPETTRSGSPASHRLRV